MLSSKVIRQKIELRIGDFLRISWAVQLLKHWITVCFLLLAENLFF